MSLPARPAGGGYADRIRTALALGPANVARVAAYRLLLRSGLHPVQRLRPGPVPPGPFFREPARLRDLPAPMAWREEGLYFGWYREPLHGKMPDWHRNPLSGRRATNTDAPWWLLPDFDPEIGDIKAIWEASRFDWAVALGQQASTGVPGALERLNAWTADWCARNPPYRGHNWKCAQEASIRVMHLCVAALILGAEGSPTPSFRELVVIHLRRILPTLSYARAQQNNHATSEAAALFVGGGVLAASGVPDGMAWNERGRSLLEGIVPTLVQSDGSFSQYSLNYHRLMLDTLALCETFRARLGLPRFSDRLLGRAASASRWLRSMVDPGSGDAPNYGANDGANLLPLTDAPYRDFRPTVALATAVFEGRLAWSRGGWWQPHLAWLEVEPGPDVAAAQGSVVFPRGGQAVLRVGRAMAFLAFPRYRFRPSHCDALHLDLWVDGEAVLLDGGSFSYAHEAGPEEDLVGAAGHNTVQFDGREQMPRLGRFLLGSWLSDAHLTPRSGPPGEEGIRAAYRDRRGGFHERDVRLGSEEVTVTDRISGFRAGAVVQWRLRPGPWKLDAAGATDGRARVHVSAGSPIRTLELREGWDSIHYQERRRIPVLRAHVEEPCLVTTRCSWAGTYPGSSVGNDRGCEVAPASPGPCPSY